MTFRNATYVSILALVCLCSILPAFGQPTSPPASDPFPSFPLPSGVVATVNFNQLGTPRITGGVGAIYPVAGSVGLYGVTGAEFYPALKANPATGKLFYSLQTNIQQEIHKDIFDTGHFSFLIGGGAGPSFSATQGTGVTVDLSAALIGSVVYQFNTKFSAVFSLKGMYIQGAGLNPVPRAGLIFNLPAKK